LHCDVGNWCSLGAIDGDQRLQLHGNILHILRGRGNSTTVWSWHSSVWDQVEFIELGVEEPFLQCLGGIYSANR
jgi:hypothetical protein